MPKRALIALATCVVATACISSETPAVNFGTGPRFVPFVVDSQDDVGQGDDVVLTSDGAPYVSYFGFQEKLEEGEIATPRPFGSPTVPGVMLSTANTQGLWQRGAVQDAEPPPELKPNGVNVPFGPVEVEDLDLTPENTNGTALTLAPDGTASMAWAAANRVDYAASKLGGTATVSTVFTAPDKVEQAGPIGRPSITLDGSGAPWVAFAVETTKGIDIHVSTQQGKDWADQIAATFPSCNGCPAPQPTGIGTIGGKVTVVYADPAARQIRAATLDGATWSDSVVVSGTIGFGLSFAAGEDAAYVAAYTGNGEVDESTFAKGSWKTRTVSEVDDPDVSATGHDAANTAVAATSDGTVYVAWEATDGVQLASGTDSFTPEDTGSVVNGGADPALATSDNGVALAWYDTTAQNQMLGLLGDLTDVVVARPSPSLVPSNAPATGECGGKKLILEISSPSTSFDTNCLVAPAGEKFTVTYHQDDATVGHNIDFMDQPGGKELAKTEVKVGPATEPVPLPPLDPGSYYFQCDVHPDQMNGTLEVVKGAK
jgi:plastocyanin